MVAASLVLILFRWRRPRTSFCMRASAVFRAWTVSFQVLRSGLWAALGVAARCNRVTVRRTVFFVFFMAISRLLVFPSRPRSGRDRSGGGSFLDDAPPASSAIPDPIFLPSLPGLRTRGPGATRFGRPEEAANAVFETGLGLRHGPVDGA